METPKLDLNKLTINLKNTEQEMDQLYKTIEIKTATEQLELNKLTDAIASKIKAETEQLNVLAKVKNEIENEILNNIPENKGYKNLEGIIFRNFKAKDRVIVNTPTVKDLQDKLDNHKLFITELNSEGMYQIVNGIYLLKTSASKPRLKIETPDDDLI